MISSIPATVTRPGISPRVTAASTAPNSGVAASSGLVRAAPMRFWLAFSSVQPTEKCTRPAATKAASAPGDAERARPRSTVASVAASRMTVETASCRKVDCHTSIPRIACRLRLWNSPKPTPARVAQTGPLMRRRCG
jgi:hypothetical protein